MKKKLRNIKSVYFIKNIFLLLHDNIKLELMKYYKSLHEIVKIDILHYKNFCNKLIIYEDNGKVLETNENDEKLYEGEYYNNKKKEKVKNIIIQVINI